LETRSPHQNLDECGSLMAGIDRVA